MPQDWFAQNAPAVKPSGDWFSANAPTPQGKQMAPPEVHLLPQSAGEWADAAKNLVGGFVEGINPLPALKSIYDNPVGTVKALGNAQLEQFSKGREEGSKGHYSEAIGHSLAGLIPLVGPAAANAGETIGSGEVARGLGLTGALLAPTAAGALGKMAKGRTALPSMLTKVPAEASAVKFGLREGLPVDVATATGNPAARGAQWLADRSLGGSIANQGRAATAAETMSSKLGDMAAGPATGGKYAGGAVFTPEQAGASVQTALDTKITNMGAAANKAYSDLRAIEADPANLKKVQTGTKPVLRSDGTVNPLFPPTPVYENMPLPVDLRSAKAALKPIYEQMSHQMPDTQRAASPAFKTLGNIIDGPDFAPASQIDADLGAIKGIARDAKSTSLYLANKAVDELSKSVDAAVAQGGKPAIDALKAGREATKMKYEVADIAKAVRDEPVQAFNQLVYSRDAGIDQLRSIAKHAPSEMPKVGSAFLNDILSTATKDGGFTPGRGATKWQTLGPETKTILFKDPAYIKDLNDFFLLSKKLAENPNPSGSAHSVSLLAQAAQLGHDPISGLLTQAGAATVSKLMHSPSVVRAMVDGMKVSQKVPKTAAATLAVSKSLNIINAAIADENSQSPRTAQQVLAPAR